MMPANDYHKTSDMPFVAYLECCNVRPHHLEDEPGSQRKVFCFVKDDKLQRGYDLFWSGKASVEPMEYYHAMKTVKTRIADFKNNAGFPH